MLPRDASHSSSGGGDRPLRWHPVDPHVLHRKQAAMPKLDAGYRPTLKFDAASAALVATPTRATPSTAMPPLPRIGLPERHYVQAAKLAKRQGDTHGHEAAKVGQYITCAIVPGLPWADRVRYFDHAIRRHCQPPPLPDETIWSFYCSLTHLVKRHAGAEAIRLASTEDDRYAALLRDGFSRSSIARQATPFFADLLGYDDHCPAWFLEDDWHELQIVWHAWA